MPLQNKSIIMGFDPGGTTGYCVGRIDNTLTLGFEVVRCNVIQWDDRIPAVKALLHHYRPSLCIVEDFVLYASKAKDQIGKRFPSVLVIGILEAYLHELSLNPMVLRLASTISRTEIPKAHQSSIPQLDAVTREHAMDAYKHIRHYLVAQKAASGKFSTSRAKK